MSQHIHRKVTLGVVIGSRAFFSPAPCKDARDEVLAQLTRLGVKAVILPYEATANGAVQSIADAELYAKHFKAHRDDIDGLVICLPNFGDEIAVAELVNRAKLNVPILLQASNDEIGKVDVQSRRDAFCGKFSVANNFWQYGVAFTETTTHTCDTGGEEFGADLERFARVCRTVRGLRNARIGAIGARTSPFQTMRFSEKLLQASGMTVVTADLSELLQQAGAIDDADPDLAAKMAKLKAYGKIPAHIQPGQILKQAKWTLAVNRWIAENGCDASAIQCWRSLQDNFGCATCVTMSMMGEELMPSACEVDVIGAVSMYALALASGQPSALLDVARRLMAIEAGVLRLHRLRLAYPLGIALTPLSNASAILQATPLVVVAGAALIFRERVGAARWAAVGIGFLGVLVILRPGLDGFVPAALWTVLGLLGFAGRDLATRAAPKVLTNFQLGLYGFAALIPAGGIILSVTGGAIAPTPLSLLPVLGAILFGVTAYWALTKAMRTGEVAVVTPFRYTRLLFALVLGILVFRESLDAATLIGAALVVGSGVYTLAAGARGLRR